MEQLIALIDDRDDQRRTLRGHIEEFMPQEWSIVDARPHASLDAAVAWVLAEKVSVLLLDERLDEAAGSQSTYTGHELATSLRMYRPELPIFVITSWEGDDELDKAAGALDDIVQRKEFASKADVHVARFVRAGQRFVDTHVSQLAELSALASAVATGEASEKQRKRAHALQAALDMSAAFDPYALQSDVLKLLESLTKRAERMLGDLAKPKKKKTTGPRRATVRRRSK
jgi:hypothetical protein